MFEMDEKSDGDTRTRYQSRSGLRWSELRSEARRERGAYPNLIGNERATRQRTANRSSPSGWVVPSEARPPA